MPSGDQSSRLIDELCAMVATLLHAPRLTLPPVDVPTRPPTPRRFPPVRMSPTGFASLLLGASLTLMFFGSIIFFIGFMLMPWIFGLAFVFYFAGILSYLPGIGKVILFPPKSDPSNPKEMSGNQRFMWVQNNHQHMLSGMVILLGLSFAVQSGLDHWLQLARRQRQF